MTPIIDVEQTVGVTRNILIESISEVKINRKEVYSEDVLFDLFDKPLYILNVYIPFSKKKKVKRIIWQWLLRN